MLDPKKNILAEWFVKNGYRELDYLPFYREVFREGIIDTAKETKTKRKGVGMINTLISPITESGTEYNQKRYPTLFYNDLTGLHREISSANEKYEEFEKNGLVNDVSILTFTNGCTYFGHNMSADNMFEITALIIEIDDIIATETTDANGNVVYKPTGLLNMFHQMKPVPLRSGGTRPALFPTPTFIVCSGQGIHLYYVFVEPIELNKKSFPQHFEAWNTYKHCLMDAMWRSETITKRPTEFQGIDQRYRCVGTPTKNHSVCRAFQVGDRVTLEYMNSFRQNLKYSDPKTHRMVECPPLAEIVNNKPGSAKAKKKKQWPRTGTLGKAAYYQAISRIESDARQGKRYWMIYCLAATARMCAIPYEQLKSDAYNLLDFLDSLTIEDEYGANHFTQQDLEDALKNYFYDGPFMKRITYERICGVKCPEPARRNGRTQEEHLALARQRRAEKLAKGEIENLGGRSLSWWSTFAYRILYPNSSKAECMRHTGSSKATVAKYWSLVDEMIALGPVVEYYVDLLYEAMQEHSWKEIEEGNIPFQGTTVKRYAEDQLEYYKLLDKYKKNKTSK